MRLIDANAFDKEISEMQRGYSLTDQSEHAKLMRIILFHTREMIKRQPTVTDTNVGNMIPTRERLPEDSSDVLALLQDMTYKVLWLNPSKDRWNYEYYLTYELNDVVAWMPLPEPYKESE